MNEKISNVYEFESEPNKISYIYSLKQNKDYLGFNYYILTKDENSEPIICEAGNTLEILQTNNANLIPITKNSTRYKKFLLELTKGLNNMQKKEKVTSRK